MKQTGERGAHAPRSPAYTLSLFHSAVTVLFCMAKQAKKRKSRDADQIFAAFRIVDAKVIGSFGHYDGARGLSAQLYDRRIIRNRGAPPVFHSDEDIFGIGIFPHNI